MNCFHIPETLSCSITLSIVNISIQWKSSQQNLTINLLAKIGDIKIGLVSF